MELTSTITSKSTGNIYKVIYRDGDPRQVADNTIPVRGIHAFCFHGGKLVLVNHPRSGWTPPGGGTEAGETIED